ncbi:hypothetical protein LINPERPRIM_LOCUS33434, partial [Linum perenne]
ATLSSSGLTATTCLHLNLSRWYLTATTCLHLYLRRSRVDLFSKIQEDSETPILVLQLSFC